MSPTGHFKFKKGQIVKLAKKPHANVIDDTDWIKEMDQYIGDYGEIIMRSKSGEHGVKYKVHFSTGSSRIFWYEEEWLEALIELGPNAREKEYCPLCGSPGRVGFNLFHCQNKDCYNFS